jgi:hypothetical protein
MKNGLLKIISQDTIKKIVYEYNDMGLLSKYTGTDGTITEYEYDKGRVNKESEKNMKTHMYRPRIFLKVTKTQKENYARS